MPQYNPVFLKPFTCWLLLTVAAIVANAQKLPAIQKSGLRAPAGIRIDGKAQEWGSFQARNNKIEAEYAMANDDQYLYLVIKVADKDVINRILAGLTLSVSRSVFKKDNEALSISYPLIPSKKALFFSLGKKLNGVLPPMPNKDSVMMARNQLIAVTYNQIGVHGAAGVDPEISIYNDDGIKAAGNFDMQGNYICEMAVALKYLDLPIPATGPLYFHISISGANANYTMQYNVPDGPAGAEFMKMNAYNASLAAITDLWGEYTLVK